MWAVIAWGKVHGSKSNYSWDISSTGSEAAPPHREPPVWLEPDPQTKRGIELLLKWNKTAVTASASVWYVSRSQRALILHTSRRAEEGPRWFGCVRQEASASLSGASSQSVGHISPTHHGASLNHPHLQKQLVRCFSYWWWMKKQPVSVCSAATRTKTQLFMFIWLFHLSGLGWGPLPPAVLSEQERSWMLNKLTIILPIFASLASRWD